MDNIFITMKQQINEIKRMQQLSGIIKESQLNEISGDFNISEDTWNKWLEMSSELEYEDYDLTTHNSLQINHLFQELKWIEENKGKYSTDEELLDAFSNFIDTI